MYEQVEAHRNSLSAELSKRNRCLHILQQRLAEYDDAMIETAELLRSIALELNDANRLAQAAASLSSVRSKSEVGAAARS